MQEKQVNIILILIDDLGCRDLGCYGSSFYETPNLDRLASEGVSFSNAYASCPVCSPTRASILSGQFPARIGVTHYIGGKDEGKLASVPYLHYLPLEQKSIAKALRENGYQTWHVGKWHLGDEAFYPENHGFDSNVGGCHYGHPVNGYFSPWGIPTLPDGPEGQYLTDHLTDVAIEKIKNRGSKPFFLNLWHYAVHTPIDAPSDLVSKYQKKAERLHLDGVDPVVLGEYFPCIEKSDQRVTRRVVQSDPGYAAMLENLDANIGRLIRLLDEEGIADDTMIIFTSDNGGLSTAEGAPTCNYPMREGKGWAFEGGVRVCQIARWPGVIPGGSVTDANVTSTDIYPTILEAANLRLDPAQHCDGVSLMPMMTGEAPLDERPIFWHFPHYGNQGGSPYSAVVKGEWKLVQQYENDFLELYNLREDVSESRNVAEVYPDVRDALLAELDAWRLDVEAKIPQRNPDWEKSVKRPSIPNNAHI